MTRIKEIQSRLDAATLGPWANYGNLGHEVYAVNAHEDVEPGYIAEVVHREPDAHFISNAPTDVQYLLAELRKAHEALAAVKEMGEQLEASELNENEFMRGRGSGFRIAGVRIRQTIRAAVAAAKGDER